MNDETNWHIIPSGDGAWALRKEGATRVTGTFETKAEAVGSARAYLTEGVVYIHERDGTIKERNAYRSATPMPSGKG